MSLVSRTVTALLLSQSLVCAPLLRAEALPAGNDDPTYLAGTRAMNERRWSDAIASFDQVIQAHGSRADAALYWKAYALGKLGKPQLTQSTCEQLRTEYRASSWNRDCGVLLMQTELRVKVQSQIGSAMPDMAALRRMGNGWPGMSSATGGGGSRTADAGHDPDADLKILAINSMLNRDPAQAVPILRGVLVSSGQPRPVKQHALFVLAQSRSPQAQSAMDELIRGRDGAELQQEAIQASGLYQGGRRNDTMEQVYRTTSDLAVKRAIVSAFFLSHDADRMVELAKMEKNLDLKRDIVSELALMPGKAATDYMMDLLK